jgi:hypothetical protein
MALDQNYHHLWFHSFKPASTSGHRDPVQIKLVPSQNLPKEVVDECALRAVDPFVLLTECSKRLFYDYLVGTRFLLKAKLTDREGVGMFFYTSFQWKPIQIEKAG